MCRLGLSLLAFEPPVPMWTTASAMSVLLWMAHTTMEVSERSIKDSLTTFNHENENNHADLFCKKKKKKSVWTLMFIYIKYQHL